MWERIDGVVMGAAKRLGFGDLRPQQMEAIRTFMQGEDVFISLSTRTTNCLAVKAA